MEITPVQHKEFNLPLPIFETVKIAEAGEFSILAGLDNNLVEQLKKYSLDESDVDIQKNTGDRQRFGVDSYEDWYRKSRTPFGLMENKTGKLAALVWLGPKPLGAKSSKFGQDTKGGYIGEWHTPAFRSYPPFRGTGLMKDFSSFVLDFYKDKFPKVRLWLGVDSKNPSGIKLFSALGFKKNEDITDQDPNFIILTRN